MQEVAWDTHEVVIETARDSHISANPTSWTILPSGALQLYWAPLPSGEAGTTTVYAPGFWTSVAYTDRSYPQKILIKEDSH